MSNPVIHSRSTLSPSPFSVVRGYDLHDFDDVSRMLTGRDSWQVATSMADGVGGIGPKLASRDRRWPLSGGVHLRGDVAIFGGERREQCRGIEVGKRLNNVFSWLS